MKKVFTITGLALHFIYYVFAILSLGNYNSNQAFEFWVFAMIISFPCLAVYLIDAIKSFSSNKNGFNIFKLLLVLLAVLMCLFIGCTLTVMCSIIWNTYFTILFLVQIISLFVKQ